MDKVQNEISNELEGENDQNRSKEQSYQKKSKEELSKLKIR